MTNPRTKQKLKKDLQSRVPTLKLRQEYITDDLSSTIRNTKSIRNFEYARKKQESGGISNANLADELIQALNMIGKIQHVHSFTQVEHSPHPMVIMLPKNVSKMMIRQCTTKSGRRPQSIISMGNFFTLTYHILGKASLIILH